jgi:hypothetical protein
MSVRLAALIQSSVPVPVSNAGASIAQVTVAAIPHWRGVIVALPATTLLALRLRPRFFRTATNTHSLSLIASRWTGVRRAASRALPLGNPASLTSRCHGIELLDQHKFV